MPGPRPSARRGTRAEDLRQHLADEIVRGILAPGTPLDESDLAARFGVSRTPVREAIRLLAASGLVETRQHRSALVARPSDEQLAAMFMVMADLEALCAGYAAVAMTARERRDLENLHRSMAPLVREGDPQQFHEANVEFHAAIYAGSHNPYLAELTATTRLRLSPFRRAQFRTLGRLSRSYAEHEVVVDAILKGDQNGAAAAMRGHIGTVEQAYLRYVGEEIAPAAPAGAETA
ncbi:GntR family transcriptional regulator [Elstera cyanobacteriorum]|uniref:GntR family transcriptional regulator n=1 Tax=Elstera cyanobacteriorum TaxID=2022747 RepID=UPI00235249FB|nr:GntR family transcriptional regulator [Elstera cyanobacteriorum]MCK6444176.1 GntR family transcriptional regulator [Elstera cyanobacteriorum]